MPEPAGGPGVLAALTLEEKAALLSGHGAWDTAAVERLGIPAVTLTDGPHGLRRRQAIRAWPAGPGCRQVLRPPLTPKTWPVM